MVDFFSEAMDLFNYAQSIRRDLHRHPELGFQEVRTAGVIARELDNLALDVSTGIAKTGVAALLRGGRPGPTVLLRADIDALPITEKTGAEYASQTDGVMHACGHDGHTAILLTVARLLNDARDDLAGTVKFVFQPAEELMSGAKRMVDEGILHNPKPDYSLALHLENSRPVGWFGVTPGPMMAGASSFHIRLHGKGGHGAIPHLAHDPIVASAQVVMALQTIVSRNVNPLETGVVSVTMVHGGDAHNVIPQEVELQGTIRTYRPNVRDTITERFRQIVEGVAATMECVAEVEIEQLTPAVTNDPGLTTRVQNVVTTMFPGEEIDTDYRDSASDDMAHMMDEIPGCYFFVGSMNSAQGLDAPHHDPQFDFDERALPRGAALMAATVMDLLGV